MSLDIGHLHQTEIDIYETIHMFKHKLLDIHVHDATLEKDIRKTTHLPLGTATNNFPNLINFLQAIYDRGASLEIQGNERENMEGERYSENLIEEMP